MTNARIKRVVIKEVDLRKLRKKKGLTLVKLEELSGIPFGMIAKYEKGIWSMTEEQADKIFKAIDNYNSNAKDL